MSYEIIHGTIACFPTTPWQVARQVVVGWQVEIARPMRFFAEISKTLPTGVTPKDVWPIKPFETGHQGGGSTDVGDVS